EAAEMALLRLIHAADLPDPAALLARMSGEGGSIAATSPASSASSAAVPPTAQLPSDYPGLIALLEQGGKHQLALQLHDQVGMVRFEPPVLVLKPLRPLGADWPRELAAQLKTLTGTNWKISLSDEAGSPSLLEQEKMADEKARADLLADANVAAVMDAFPAAELEPPSKGT
ncbi:MAG: DNA polymerase III subunit gamma/tau, partial [Sphingomicrobium sp.]